MNLAYVITVDLLSIVCLDHQQIALHQLEEVMDELRGFWVRMEIADELDKR